ncbi:MAG: hypothetical protein KatS3mg058_4663 [Roseiflexus sp.]|nr:MAG: hypothetical protein KatS3mg058_4663 [Roseiflexus sp.]
MASREIYLAFVARGERREVRGERRAGPDNGVARDLSRICGEARARVPAMASREMYLAFVAR